MPEFCTCGAQLPPDALFCHKCGKPQREIVIPETVAPPPVAETAPAPHASLLTPPAAAPLPLNFHNRAAVKIALLVAGLATLLSFLLYVNWFLAGFLAVFLYRRRTGQVLNLESGVRMGWITGLMTFGIMVLILGALGVSVQAIGGVSAFQAEFKGAMDPRMAESLKILTNPSELAWLLVQFFVFTTLLSMAGGALGVKLAGLTRPTGS
jgi:uncharacterized membrane protein